MWLLLDLISVLLLFLFIWWGERFDPHLIRQLPMVCLCVTRKPSPWLLIVSGIKWLWSLLAWWLVGLGLPQRSISYYVVSSGLKVDIVLLQFWCNGSGERRKWGIFNWGWLGVFSFLFYNQNGILVMSDQNGWINRFFCSCLIKTCVISVWTKSHFAPRNKRLWTP